jgi:cytochrome P450
MAPRRVVAAVSSRMKCTLTSLLHELSDRQASPDGREVRVARTIEDLDDSTFDPYVADDAMFGDIEDPYTPLAELRAIAPVVESDMSGIGSPVEMGRGYDREFTVVSYAGVEQVLTDPATFSNRPLADLLSNYGPLLSGMDPPEHTRYRRIFQHAFRPAVLHDWAQQIVNPVVDELAQRLRRRGAAELVEDFARPYPFQIVYRMLALPPEDIEVFYRLTMAQIVTPDAAEASAKLSRYFARMLADRRAGSGEHDLVSVVASARVDGEALPDDVAIAFLLQLMSAAGETTFRTTTVLLVGLLTNPEQLEAVRDDRTLVPQAIEEALRWDGPVVTTPRSTSVDAVVDGVPVPANSLLNVSLGAANRDPAVFADPDRFDIFRERHRHFGFALATHNCLGQQLARLELHTALHALLDALPHVRLDPERPPPRLRGAAMRTPRELHVLRS